MSSLPQPPLQHSPSCSMDSLTLFPRPLAFRRTITSKSPLLSPTPLGRHVENASSPRGSVRRIFTDKRPVTRGKSPRSTRATRISTAFCLPRTQSAVLESTKKSNYRNLEENPFTNRLGLSRFGGDKRRSSIASLSTLKIPKSFRPIISRAGSSIYSRDTKGLSVLPSPGLASEFSISLQSLPEAGPIKRAASLDETILEDFGWMPLTDEDAIDERRDSGTHESAGEKLDSEDHAIGGVVPQTSALSHAHPPRQIETTSIAAEPASPQTFHQKMQVPTINIARSSDDVFTGARPNPRQMMTEPEGFQWRDRNETLVVEQGRVFQRVRAMECKISCEDLVRYGGKTAPGGVEWF
jgi:hypothetical protein